MCRDDATVLQSCLFSSAYAPDLVSILWESEVTVGGALLSFRLHRLGKQRRKANVRTSHLEPEPSRAFMSSRNRTRRLEKYDTFCFEMSLPGLKRHLFVFLLIRLESIHTTLITGHFKELTYAQNPSSESPKVPLQRKGHSNDIQRLKWWEMCHQIITDPREH